MIDDLQFKMLDKQGVETLVKWAEEEGWNPGPGDAEVYWQTDNKGFYGFFSNDELIGGGSIVSYNGDFGFMGFFIVKPEYRGKGIGNELWYLRRNTLLKRLKKDAPIGMDGVVDMQPFYNKGGFKIAFRDERYKFKTYAYKYDKQISPIEIEDYPDIVKYDSRYFGFERPQFLIPWMDVEGTKTFKYTENNEIYGYIIIRKAYEGFKVCPLFAENQYIAEELFKAGMNYANGDSLFLDIPVINKDAVDLVKKYKGEYVFECARMYYGEPPKTDINKIFGITTFELG